MYYTYHQLINITYMYLFMQALLEEVKAHRPSLTEAVTSGRALEAYVREKGATGIADLGYTRMEERYITLEVNYPIVF